MSLKSEAATVGEPAHPSITARMRPRSLRLQLMLWYGGLVAASLVIFAILVLVLSTKALYDNVDNAISAEVRVAMFKIEQALSPNPPYWPSNGLILAAPDNYQDPGVTVEVVDPQSRPLYPAINAPDIHTKRESMQSIQAAVRLKQPQDYITTVGGERVKGKAVPIMAPASTDVVGVLLVAKSLKEVDQDLFFLNTFLILSGLIALAIALVSAWAISANVLRPLREVVKTSRAIASTEYGAHLANLSQRVPRPRGHDEILQVIDTLNDMLASLERTTLAQRRFVADASHELRAPLTTIQGNLAFLQRYIDELPLDERRTMLNDAYGETLRLALLVEELLLLARADANADKAYTHEQRKEEGRAAGGDQERLVELDHELLQLVRQLRGRLNLEGSKLKLEIGHIEPVRVRGEEESLRRVMLILLDNALKYTPGGENDDAGRITVSLERVGKEAALHVRDTGIGIEPEDLPYIFDRFYRADRARPRQGSGLGLSIAHTLVEQMGGRITVQSVPGEGSTFSIWLPVAQER